jgi:hypothetical protein
MNKFIILLWLAPQLLLSKNVAQSLHTDLEQGKLSYSDYLKNLAYAIYQPEKLPLDYQEALKLNPLKSGTMIVQEIKHNWNKITHEMQKSLTPYFLRPNLPYDWISSSGHFRIHYTLSSSDSVPKADANQNTIPDYVEHIGEIFDYCYHLELDSLGYQPPPNDNGADGGDEYDVYLHSLGNVYGYTNTDVPGTRANSYASYMELDNDYKNYPTAGLDGARVTIAHEYFHAIQMGYKFIIDDSEESDEFWENDIFFYEISSTWMEDVCFNNINDYYNYLFSFFADINLSFDTRNGSYEYGNCLWNHMLVKKYGADVIRTIWENINTYSALEANNLALEKVGSSLNHELSDYCIWNYFTGARADTNQFYPEGKNYPLVESEVNKLFNSDTTITRNLDHLSYSYYNLLDQQYRNTITIIPLNLERDHYRRATVVADLSRSMQSDFNEIAYQCYMRLIMNNSSSSSTRIIVTDAYGEVHIDTIVDKPKIGYGPNPFVVNRDVSFNVYYQLNKKSSVTISIFTEDGHKIRDFKYPDKDSGPHRFSWDQTELGRFPGGTGIYLLLFKTNYSQELIKFAVIQ